MDEEELLTRLAEEEEMGLSYMKKCEQGIEDTVQLDLEVERLQVNYWIIVFLVGFPCIVIIDIASIASIAFIAFLAFTLIGMPF